MFYANENYALLPESYLFTEVARRLKEYRVSHSDREVIRMDIGDVSLPLPEVVVKAICSAAREMGSAGGFHGYGPEQGYLFLREAIARGDYHQRGLDHIGADDIFISDGAKSDLGNLTDIFGEGVRIAVAEPGYPVYVDANVLDGRAGAGSGGRWENLVYLNCRPEKGFIPEVPDSEEPGEVADIIYLCYPNNPTGASMRREQLAGWVDYALRNKSLIIFDSAYEAYVRHPEAVRSVYEVPGAERVAIEIRSFSKTAGFTGVRCGYTVVPRTLSFTFRDGESASLNRMWGRRQSTKFNGVGYIVQRGAEALYTPEGQQDIRRATDYYMRNAAMLREALLKKGWRVVGGEDSPYIWTIPDIGGRYVEGRSLTSWQLFERLLDEAQISSTPGSGFGSGSEGWIRFTGFNTRENTLAAIKRLADLSEI
ncbi:MAG: LL-diaminopimelate aminotransferase [Muribaculaceae bacterium]|nr:LL-diaminopimelate aminotransferase [Muribaculaceae bacterium]